MPVGNLLPELTVLIAAVINLFLATSLGTGRQWLGAPLALAGLALAFWFALQQFSLGDRFTFSGVWALDGASIATKLLILAATALVVLLAPGWLQGDRRHGEYYSILLLGSLSAIIMGAASDTMQLVLGVLLSSVTGYVLAAYHRDWSLSLEAGMKFFLIGALTNTFLLIGVVLLFGIFASTDYQTISQLAFTAPDSYATTPLLVAVGLGVVGLAFKLGAFPAHAWLPDVAEGSPLPSAAFLTVIPKIGAALGLARFLELFPEWRLDWPMLIAVLATVTMTLGNLGALWQDDVRRLLGWSAISQSGYVLAAVAVVSLSDRGLSALVFFLTAYASANLAAFAVVTQLRGRTKIEHYRGMGKARPWLGAGLVLSLLSLVGIPPLVGFAGKLMIFVAAIDADYAWLAVAVVLNTVVSLFYYLRVIAPMYFDAPGNMPQLLGRWSATAALLSGLAVVLLGLLANALLDAFASFALA